MPNLTLYGWGPAHGAVYVGNVLAIYTYFNDETHKQELNLGASKMCLHTPVHVACYGSANAGTLITLKLLGADMFIKDQFGRMPLNVAANAGKKDPVKTLIQLHKDENPNLNILSLIDIMGNTVFHHLCMLASSEGEKAKDAELAETLEILLAEILEADRAKALTAKNIVDRTPLEYAKANGYLEVVNAGTGAKEPSKLAKVFEKYGIDLAVQPAVSLPVEERDFFSRSQLMQACFAGSDETVQAALALPEVKKDEEFYLNGRNKYMGGRSTIHMACGGIAPPSVLKLLLSEPICDPHNIDDNGTNALMYAANTGIKALLDTLIEGVVIEGYKHNRFSLEERANGTLPINDQDGNGYSALHAAALVGGRPTGRGDIISALIVKYNIDYNLKDKEGKTALELAEDRGLTAVATKIREAIAAKQAVDQAKSAGAFLPALMLAVTAAPLADQMAAARLLASNDLTPGVEKAKNASKLSNP